MLVSCALVAAPAGPGLAAQAHDPQHAAAHKAKPPPVLADDNFASMTAAIRPCADGMGLERLGPGADGGS